MMLRWLLASAALMLASQSVEAAERDYCPTRPGLDTTPCTMMPGRVSVETALGDWIRDDQPDARSDTVLIGDSMVRLGLTDRIEAQLGWTPYGHVRERDKRPGVTTHAAGVGDLSVGFKENVRNPDGSGVSIAVQPFATLPVGGGAIGAGDWAAGVLVPVTIALNDTLGFATTTELDAAVDADRHGRHAAYSEVIGLNIKLTKRLEGAIEAQVLRDEDPAGAVTRAVASASLGFMANDATQFDTGIVVGLNRAAPALELYLGVSRRF